MMRRCILELSKRRVPNQRLDFHLLRKCFSSSSRHNASQKPSGSVGKPPVEPKSVNKTPESGKGNISKLVVGGVLITGVVAAAAYQSLYLNQPNPKEESVDFGVGDKREKVIVNEQIPSPSLAKDEDVVHVEKNEEANLDKSPVSDKSTVEGEGELKISPKEEATSVQQTDLPSFSQDAIPSDDKISHSETPDKDIIVKKEVDNGFTGTLSSQGQNEVVKATPSSQDAKMITDETERKEPSTPHLTSQDASEVTVVDGSDPPNSLIDVYHLGDKNEKSTALSLDGKKQGPVGDSNISKDGNLVLDFLEAIHAAEKRQAELDAAILAEEKRILKEKYEKELRDARGRELLSAEQAAILHKELNNEITKAAATVRTLQEKAEENLKMELERKDSEVEIELKKVKELAQAELAAAIAREKASQIEKMAEANLHINALCMAFYARSEEARQSHSVHKLALGALALEDALSKGLPIQTEISALHTSLEGIDKDSLINLVLSSLPEETLNHGTETQLQLNQQFETLKTKLRHYSLIPATGGGILTHAVAHFTSKIKVRENDTSGDGIESIISRVETLLAEGKLVEAADALETGVKGSQAEAFVNEWVKQARNRAITEQALSLLQSYATAISVT